MWSTKVELYVEKKKKFHVVCKTLAFILLTGPCYGLMITLSLVST